jgi:hypothetical protein
VEKGKSLKLQRDRAGRFCSQVPFAMEVRVVANALIWSQRIVSILLLVFSRITRQAVADRVQSVR